MIVKLQRYIATGGAAAVVDVFGFDFMLLLRLPITLAAVLSWLMAAFVNYHLTSRFVFGSSVSRNRLLQFLLGSATGLCLNTGVTVTCAVLFGLNPLLSKVAGIATAFAFNFLVNLLWVFNDRPRRAV